MQKLPRDLNPRQRPTTTGASIPDVREELGNCLHILLSIGTLANTDTKKDPQRHEDISEDLPRFTIEEAKELQKELVKLLSRKLKKSSARGPEIAEDDRVDKARRFKLESSEDVNHGGDLSPDTRIILHKLKDALSCNHTAIEKKPLSFLLRKMFVCGRGFAQTRSFKGLIAEPTVEKILKAILTKKIYPQSSAPTLLMIKRNSDHKSMEEAQAGKADKRKDHYKWVKTDSEYIVLEI